MDRGKIKTIRLLLTCLAVVLLACFVATLYLDYANYNEYSNSAPFYVCLIIRTLEFLLPAVLCMVGKLIVSKRNRR